jgi:hypothetical protein
MSKKIYKTAMGKTVDMGALQLQNETVRAVGNMNVNARGDTLNSNNQIIDKKSTDIVKNLATIFKILNFELLSEYHK